MPVLRFRPDQVVEELGAELDLLLRHRGKGLPEILEQTVDPDGWRDVHRRDALEAGLLDHRVLGVLHIGDLRAIVVEGHRSALEREDEPLSGLGALGGLVEGDTVEGSDGGQVGLEVPDFLLAVDGDFLRGEKRDKFSSCKNEHGGGAKERRTDEGRKNGIDKKEEC